MNSSLGNCPKCGFSNFYVDFNIDKNTYLNLICKKCGNKFENNKLITDEEWKCKNRAELIEKMLNDKNDKNDIFD